MAQRFGHKTDGGRDLFNVTEPGVAMVPLDILKRSEGYPGFFRKVALGHSQFLASQPNLIPEGMFRFFQHLSVTSVSFEYKNHIRSLLVAKEPNKVYCVGMYLCESELLTKCIADLGSNGIAKFAASAEVSISTVNLCLSGIGPKKLSTRVKIAKAAGLAEPVLFSLMESLAGESSGDKAG